MPHSMSLLAALLLWGCSTVAQAHKRNLLGRASLRAHRRAGPSAILAVGTGVSEASPLSLGESKGRLTLKHLYPWYHTTDELRREARELVGHCNGAMSLKTWSEGDVHIDVATVRAVGASPKNRVFIIFGEHSRELISPESGLYFLHVLCGQRPGRSTHTAEEVLKESEFQVVINGNPRSRKQVEFGHFCTRANPDGVDLNRNWDEEWKADPDLNMYPGPYPFSEPETRIFRNVLTNYMPTAFLTVHSGTRGLYMPWAYDMEHLAKRNQGAMLQILKVLDKDHCECPYGAAGKEVGYSCPGTCLDWAYDKLKTPYSFAFEIYVNPDEDKMLKMRWDEKMHSQGKSLLQDGHHLGHAHFLDLFQHHASDFVQTRSPAKFIEGEEICFSRYNPDTQERFNATLSNWAGAFLDMASMVVEDMRQQGMESSSNSSAPVY